MALLPRRHQMHWDRIPGRRLILHKTVKKAGEGIGDALKEVGNEIKKEADKAKEEMK